MNAPKISIFTCSYNKHHYVGDAIESVLAQTMGDFEYWILENSTDEETREHVKTFKDDRIKYVERDFTPAERSDYYTESRLKNRYFPEAAGEYIMVLSDDDYLLPNCFERHLQDIVDNPSHRINYHTVNCVFETSGIESRLVAANIFTAEEGRTPGCNTDGGAVMFERDMQYKLQNPLFIPGWEQADTSDGIFLNRLVEIDVFYPLGEDALSVKRVTPISTHHKD